MFLHRGRGLFLIPRSQGEGWLAGTFIPPSSEHSAGTEVSQESLVEELPVSRSVAQ